VTVARIAACSGSSNKLLMSDARTMRSFGSNSGGVSGGDFDNAVHLSRSALNL
jgi:hypothetical protein